MVKTAPSLSNLRNVFSVEAVFCARSFAGSLYNPVFVKTDNALKSGFGMVGQEHPAFKVCVERHACAHVSQTEIRVTLFVYSPCDLS